MPVISFVSSKGGVGKSTAALVVAGEILDAGSTVTIIDADPNQPIVGWAEMTGLKKGLNVIGQVNEENIIPTIEKAATETAFVVIDLEGSANMMVGYAISRSDLAIVPAQASFLDGEGAAAAINLIDRTVDAFKTKVDKAVLLSRTSAAVQPRILKQLQEMFAEGGVDVFKVQMIDRAAFRAIFAYGGTVHDLKTSEVSNLDAAKDNAAAFIEEVIARLNPDLVKADREVAA